MYRIKKQKCIRRKTVPVRDGKDSLRNLRIVFIDIDNLKYINDNYGHYAGEEAIKTVAK